MPKASHKIARFHKTARFVVSHSVAVCRVRSAREPVVLLRRVQDVDSVLWLPGRPHTLAFGASGLYGTGMLALWEGRALRRLVRVAHPDEEMFRVVGASADGRTLVYSRGRDTAKGIVWHQHRLRLPSRAS